MHLELRPINDTKLHVFSKRTSKFVGNIILDNTEWVFEPYDCGCVWTSEVIFELGTIIQNINNQ
jgi:hypothetical protein